MTEQLESKLTFGDTYNQARHLGFGRITSAYWALPSGIENASKNIRKMLFPVFEIDNEAKTYHLKSNGLFGNVIAETYGEHLELKGYKKI